MNTISVRFGLHGIPIFPNAATFKLKIKEKDFAPIANAVFNLRSVLDLAGQTAISDKLFFEKA